MAIQLRNVMFLIKHPRSLIKKIQGEIWSFFNPDKPWLSPKAIDYCEEILQPSMTIFEWGSGRSTLWFSKRVSKVISVEHHKGWYEKIQKIASQQLNQNVELKFVDLDHPESEPSHARYVVLPRYVKEIDNTDVKNFDLVVIDGAYRMACVIKAIPKVKPGGFMMIDNSNWMPLKDWGVPEDWKIVHDSLGYEGATTIWQKSK